MTICGNRSWIRAESTALPIFIAGRPAYRIVAEGELADALAKLTDTDQRFETTWAHTRATKGDSTHIAMSTSRIRESLRRPARSIKPTEPPAPASAAIRAAVRRRPGTHPRAFPGSL